MVPMGNHGCRRRPGKSREEHAGEDGGDRQSTPEMADAGNREPDDAPRDPARRHEGRGEDEEGNGEQRVVLRRGKQLQRDRGHGIVGEEGDRQNARKTERDCDRHAEKQQAEDEDEENGGFHVLTLSPSERLCFRRPVLPPHGRRSSSRVRRKGSARSPAHSGRRTGPGRGEG